MLAQNALHNFTFYIVIFILLLCIWISSDYENTVCDTESFIGYTSTREGIELATLSVLFHKSP